jgi:quinol monooxygenase YgiN
MFCVLVRFQIKAGFEEKFREQILANAAASLEDEPGCHTFDVCAGSSAGTILLYELYDSEQAFKDHLETPHFKRFNADTTTWVENKSIETYMRLSK